MFWDDGVITLVLITLFHEPAYLSLLEEARKGIASLRPITIVCGDLFYLQHLNKPWYTEPFPLLQRGIEACPPRPETGTGSGGATWWSYVVN